VVFPAHDYRGNLRSTIGREKASNPRVAGRSSEQYVTLMNNLGLPLPDKIQESLQSNQSAIEDDSLQFPDVAQLSGVRQIDVAELKRELMSDHAPSVLDVREPDEYSDELGHIRGSWLIPLKALPARAAELEGLKNKEVVVVCRAGVRSTTAAAILTALGFEHVSNLKGGMVEWNEAALPVER
jgi:rhodanese-related sulfurtransferase